MVLSHRANTLLVSALLLGLSACATPQQQCIATVSAETRSLSAKIKETEATIARGYALHRQSVPYQQSSICYDREKQPHLCWQTRFRKVETPVTVDIPNEKSKLASMKARFGAVQRKAVSGIKACRKTYPE